MTADDGPTAPPRTDFGAHRHARRDARKHDPAFHADLERLELALCDREPYVRTARMWQVVARRSGPAIDHSFPIS